MSEEKLSLGQYFKIEREKRGIGLKDIEKKTKISAQTLAFLEDDNLAMLPPKTFLRGFLQVIAKEFDMDAGELMEYLDEALDSTDNREGQKFIPGQKKARGIFRAVVVAIVLVVLVAVGFCMNREKDEPAEAACIESQYVAETPIIAETDTLSFSGTI